MKSILEEAHEIVNERSEERDRRYGDFDESMDKMSKLATIMCGKEITIKDCFMLLMALKLSRESYAHTTDNLRDLCGYVQGLENYLGNTEKT